MIFFISTSALWMRKGVKYLIATCSFRCVWVWVSIHASIFEEGTCARLTVSWCKRSRLRFRSVDARGVGWGAWGLAWHSYRIIATEMQTISTNKITGDHSCGFGAGVSRTRMQSRQLKEGCLRLGQLSNPLSFLPGFSRSCKGGTWNCKTVLNP